MYRSDLRFAVLLRCCFLSIVTHYPALLHPLTLECPSHNTKVIGQMPVRFAPSSPLRLLLGLLILFNPLSLSRNLEFAYLRRDMFFTEIKDRSDEIG